jgi:hypothetical protein
MPVFLARNAGFPVFFKGMLRFCTPHIIFHWMDSGGIDRRFLYYCSLFFPLPHPNHTAIPHEKKPPYMAQKF